MKRKRGHKKGKSKKLRLTPEVTTNSNHDEEMSPNSEGNSGSEDENDDSKPEVKAQPEVESKVETLPEKVEKEVVVNVRPEVVVIQRPPTTAVYGRVKLKLKTSKPIVVDSQKQLPPVLGRSDAEKSTQKVVIVDKQVSVDKKEGVLGVKKVEESANSLPESKKYGGIKIVSGSQQVANVDTPVVSVDKQVGVLVAEKGEESANMLPGSKKSGGIKIVTGDKQVNVDKQQGVPIVENREDGVNSLLESRKCGGIKIVSGKGLSPPGRKDITPSRLMLGEKEKKLEGESANPLPESKKFGGIKIVSGKGLSPTGRKDSSPNGLMSEEKEKKLEGESVNSLPESKKFGGIKIVSGKGLSPPGRKDSSPNGLMLEEKEMKLEGESINLLPESKKFGGIKIVSGKGLSPPGRKDSSPSGLMLEEKEKKSEGESANSLPESKKFGGIKIVSGKGLSPPGRKDSSSSGLMLEEKEKKLEGESVNSLPESKKFGGIKIVSGKGLSPPERKDSSPTELMLEEKKRKLEEESPNSLPQSKKFGGIKIVSGTSLSPPGRKESSPSVGLLQEKGKQEVKVANLSSRYNKKGLEASLEVVKKVMKMDAAEPFNMPVNPVKLGIPDYFDIIDTPMDFGTVLKNLESGAKYMNSKDVYQDVQYIWNNCYKYNNKGDYVVDLMKRVKKNFMKYWMEAGLYTEQTRKQTGGEGTPMDEATTSGQGKKIKRGKGFKLHKDGCMCAICIMKRRRKEREAREAGVQVTSPRTEVGKTGLAQEYKQEENSHVESPFGEETSSYLETSPDDVDAEMEDAEETRLQYDDDQKMDENNRVDKSDRSGDVSDRSHRSDKFETESYSQADTKIQDESANVGRNYPSGQPLIYPEGQITEHMRQRHEQLEVEKKRQKLRLLETFRDLENPMLSELCTTLFPSNSQSVWNGANSLIRSNKAPANRSALHDALASFMTPSYKSSSLK